MDLAPPDQPIASFFPDAGAAPVPVLRSIRARRAAPGDHAFLKALYASTRAEEMAATGWPADVLDRFLGRQFQLQHDYYRAHYGDASFLLLLRAGVPVGRLYWWAGSSCATLIDLSLSPSERGKGLGSALLGLLTAQAGARGQAVSLHVEPANPARRLYERFGFAPGAGNGVHLQMHRPAPAPSHIAAESESAA